MRAKLQKMGLESKATQTDPIQSYASTTTTHRADSCDKKWAEHFETRLTRHKELINGLIDLVMAGKNFQEAALVKML